MSFVLQPWQLLLVILAGWVNRQQQQVFEYLRTENQVLKEKVGKRRILLNDDQRRRLKHAGVDVVRLPPRSPHLTPHIERFMRSIKEECRGRMIFFGEQSLREAINAFCEHYHHERNHQGLGNHLIDPGDEVGITEGAIACRERLGGLLRYYYRQAA